MTICQAPQTQRYSIQDDKECEAQLVAGLKVEAFACVDTLAASIVAVAAGQGKDYSQEMPYVKARVLDKLFGDQPAPKLAADHYEQGL